MKLVVAGVNFRRTPVALREKFSVSQAALADCYRSIPVDQKLILFTCNRTEIVMLGRNGETIQNAREFFCRQFPVSRDDVDRHMFVFEDSQALKHLYRLAAGLDSAIIGETEVFGQLKNAYHTARHLGMLQGELDIVFQDVFETGKLVRRKTALSVGGVSTARAALELAETRCGLAGRQILVIGTGKISSATAKCLAGKSARTVFIANRTYEKARKMADESGAHVVRFDRLQEFLASVEIVFSATSAPHFILTEENSGKVLAARRKSLLIIDMAVPRDVAPVLNRGKVTIFTIDDLRNVIDANLEKRKHEAVKAERIIEERLEHHGHTDRNQNK